MSARAYYGRSGYDPSTLPDYYGPTGDDMAQAFAHRDERARTMAKEKLSADEANLRMEGERKRQKHVDTMTPLEEALERAAAAEKGITFPGQNDGQPPSQSPSGPPVDRGLPRPGPKGPGLDDVYDMAAVQGTAHALPGSFNPVTGTHNPADIDLGGGFSLSGDMTPRGRRAQDVTDLGGFGFNNKESGYLSRHPEHLAPFMERMNGNRASGWHPQSMDEAVRFYRMTHPREEWDANQPRGGLTMQQALIEARTMAAGQDASRTGDEGDEYTYRGPLAGRDYMRAQRMYYGPGGSGFHGGAPRAPAVAPRSNGTAPARSGAGAAPAPKAPAAVSRGAPSGGNDRASQIQQIRAMVPPNASPAHVRAVLKKHGLSDDEIAQVIGQRE